MSSKLKGKYIYRRIYADAFLKAEKFKSDICIYSNRMINSAFRAHLAGSYLRIQLYKLWFFNSYLVETRKVEKR